MNRRAVSVLVLGAVGVAAFMLAGAGSAKPESGGAAAKKRCHYVVKRIHGKKRRVRVCTKPKPAPSWDYVALGDSLTTGGGRVSPNETYPSAFGRLVKADTGKTVKVNNLGQDGATSSDLLDGVKNFPSYRQPLRGAEIVTVDIGYNDFGSDVIESYSRGQCGGPDNEDCLRNMVARFRTNFDAILDELVTLVDPKKKIIRVLNQYNNIIGNPDLEALLGPTFGQTVGKKYTEALNDATCEAAQAQGVQCADVYHAFNGPTGLDNLFTKDLLADGDHPNAKGHQLIAAVLRGLGYAPLRPR